MQHQQEALTHLAGLLLSLSDAETANAASSSPATRIFSNPTAMRARSLAELAALRALVGPVLPAGRLDAIAEPVPGPV
ncbi:MAG: hypothetical protein IPM99_26995 [Rubrivivax sp.]|nr:hypothetical protein [Rubrivivax sp.]